MANTTYYPSKTFDDDFATFVEMAKGAGWTFPNVDIEELAQDAATQRAERQALDLIQAETAREEAEFAQRQLARFQRFSAALNAARGAFRHDQAILAKLEQFKRRSRSRKQPTLNESSST